jgi:hypothetical protein
MGSKKYMEPHPAYAAEDMPARKLAAYVRQGLKSGAGIEPIAIAEALFQVASQEQKVPLHLPLGSTAVMLIKMKLKARLEGLDAVAELSAIAQ